LGVAIEQKYLFIGRMKDLADKAEEAGCAESRLFFHVLAGFLT